MKKKKIIIVGGGFGGLATAKELSNQPNFDVILIDVTNHHLFQPLLYQVACAALRPADIAVPIREILKNSKNIVVIMAEVLKIRKEENLIELSTGNKLNYDYLILAVGARHSYFGHDWEKFAPGLKTLGDALEIRRRMLLAYERIETKKFFHNHSTHCQINLVIIGGGPTGVELAGAMSEIAKKVLRKNFRMIHPEQTKIYLIEGSPRLLAQFPPDLSERTLKDLEALGVIVMTNTHVEKIDEKGVYTSNTFIPTTEVFWAAGNSANPLLKTLDCPLDKSGRVIVNNDLSIPGDHNIFVIGDAACLKDPVGVPYPALATVAKQQGVYVGKIIRKQIDPKQRVPFKYLDRGVLATIGKNHAIGVVFGWKVTGFFAWIVWNLIHLTHIIGFGNKLIVMTEWAYSYVTSSRVSRLIYKGFGDQIIDKKEG